MIKTLQPTRYDASVDANCTLDEYINGNYAGLPNESMLEEQWNDLPEAIEGKPVRLRWNRALALTIPLTAPVRFFMNRLTDVTGVSGTGKVLTGVILPSGSVLIEWMNPHQTMGLYGSFAQFMTIHVESHPDANEVVFID